MSAGRTRNANRVTNRYCSVPQCKNKQSDEISLHLLPKRADLRRQWLHCLKIGKKPAKFTFVCSMHFLKTDYILPGR